MDGLGLRLGPRVRLWDRLKLRHNLRLWWRIPIVGVLNKLWFLHL